MTIEEFEEKNKERLDLLRRQRSRYLDFGAWDHERLNSLEKECSEYIDETDPMPSATLEDLELALAESLVMAKQISKKLKKLQEELDKR